MIPLHCLTLQNCCKQTKSQFSLCFFHYRMDLSWSKVNKVKYFKALLWLLLLLYYCRLLLLNYFICWHKLNYLVRINHRIMVYTNNKCCVALYEANYTTSIAKGGEEEHFPLLNWCGWQSRIATEVDKIYQPCWLETHKTFTHLWKPFRGKIPSPW